MYSERWKPGAASSSGPDQFDSQPASSVSSTYSPLPSPEGDDEGQPPVGVDAAPSAKSDDSASDDEQVDSATWSEWRYSDEHTQREREHAERADRIANEALCELLDTLPVDECPSFDVVLHWTEFLLLGDDVYALDSDVHALERVLEHFLIKDEQCSGQSTSALSNRAGCSKRRRD